MALSCLPAVEVPGGATTAPRMAEPLLPFPLHRTIHSVSRQLGCQALQPLAFCAVAPRVSSFRYGCGAVGGAGGHGSAL